jgi:transcriptional regulator with XRE-family HTH domain
MEEQLPNRLRELRKANKKSGNKIAELLGITPQYYYDLETGRKRLNEDHIRQLADIFNVSIDYILGRSDNRNELAVKGNRAPYTVPETAILHPSNGDLFAGLPDDDKKSLLEVINVYRQKNGLKPYGKE